jgi:hypothetical protein
MSCMNYPTKAREEEGENEAELSMTEPTAFLDVR